VADIEVASRYVAGGTRDEPMGGDWFAFIPVGERALGVALGDVVGHGLDAVSAMVEYRFTMRVVAGDGCDPAVALSRLQTALRLYGQDTMGTAVYGVLDAERGLWTYANAGHLPPIVVSAAGSPRLLECARGPMFVPLGRDGYASSCVTVEPGDVVALYTDGLVERRGESLTEGIGRLSEHLAHAELSDLEAAVDDVIASLAGEAPSDDVALVLLRICS
jgi:serine phosphatase RsbU (regulator of sigma subunit)